MYRGKFPKVSIVLYKFCKNICLILSSGTGNINIASGEYGYGSGIMFFRRHSCDSDRNLFLYKFRKNICPILRSGTINIVRGELNLGSSIINCSSSFNYLLIVRMSLPVRSGLSLRDYVDDTFNRTCELVSLGQRPEPVISFDEWKARKRAQASNPVLACLLLSEPKMGAQLQQLLTPDVIQLTRSVNNAQPSTMAPASTQPLPPQPVQQLPPLPPVQQQMNHAAQPNQTSERVRSSMPPTLSRPPPPGTPPP